MRSTIFLIAVTIFGLAASAAPASKVRSEKIDVYKVARGMENFPLVQGGRCAGMVTVPLEDEDGRVLTLQCRGHELQVNVAAYATCVFTLNGPDRPAVMDLFSPRDCNGFVNRLKSKIEAGNLVVIAKYVTTDGRREVTNLFAVRHENDMPSWDPADQKDLISTGNAPNGVSGTR